MSKIDITYIGEKATKKDTVTSSRLLFPRGKAVSVDSDVAHRLLDYPKVWVLSADAEDIVQGQEARAKALAEKLAEEKIAAEKANLDQSMLVIVDGETLDIGKYSGKQLETLVVAAELTITVNPKPVPQYREAIRDELRKLNGTPEPEGQE
jgi:hypothetical protein